VEVSFIDGGNRRTRRKPQRKRIVLYLDDGFGMSDSFWDCQKDSVFVKQSFVDADF
jgi:hypothetical protein